MSYPSETLGSDKIRRIVASIIVSIAISAIAISMRLEPCSKETPEVAPSLSREEPSSLEFLPPLRVSENGRFLIRGDGKPFFWLADTAWALHQNLGIGDVRLYLDDTASHGFNVIQLMSVNDWALRNGKNFYGDAPYVDGIPWHLNLPYWEYLGRIIDEAARRDLYVLLVYGAPGRRDGHGGSVQRPEDAYAYGYVLGELFRKKTNLIWASGIDVNPDDPERASPMGLTGWHAMAEGITDGINGVDRFDGEADYSATLMTYHPSGHSTSSIWFHDAPWLDFNGAQLGLGDLIVSTIADDYARKPAKPVINLEPWYEESPWKEPPVTAFEARAQAYQSVFAGAFGHTYGHFRIWPLHSPGIKYSGHWCKSLDAPGRTQMHYLRTLFESVPSLSRRPLPTLVTASADNGHRSHRTLEHIAATGDVAGAWALVYSPRGASFTVDLSQLRSPQVAGRWFDPRTGTFREIGAISTSSTYVFDPPGDAGEGNDHVLVLCATVAN